eukprot:c23773_g1_i1 orf=818-3448(-)
MDGDRSSFQLDSVFSPRAPHKRARWEDVDADSTLGRNSAGVAFHTQISNAGNQVSHLPISRFQSQAYSTSPLKGLMQHAVPVNCGSLLGQVPSPSCHQFSPVGNHLSNGTSSMFSPVFGGSPSYPKNINLERSPTTGGNIGETHSNSSESLQTSAVNVAEILAELERERKKNAELLERISLLEARWGEEDRGVVEGSEHVVSVASLDTMLRSCDKSALHGKIEKFGDNEVSGSKKMNGIDIEVKQEEGLQTVSTVFRGSHNCQENAVTWMSHEDVLPADSHKAVTKDADSDREESIESDDSDDDDSSTDDNDDDEDDDDEEMQSKDARRRKVKRYNEGDFNAGTRSGSDDVLKRSEGKTIDIKEQDEGTHAMDVDHFDDRGLDEKTAKRRKKKGPERKKSKAYEKIYHEKKASSYEILYRAPGMMASYRKVPKKAFCPEEVKRIMESGVLAMKNAQSHTMRKIIVFASLCIRHGCEDLYELDFNHFSVVRRGEPYVSPKDPGEHVLYEHPGIRRRIFYPNKQNPMLCPVRILDEEMAMRPSGPSCPSCLFLCIKYGGRTRNLPQNEYVRQRMGRNKLKSFGPLMCQMALLVHIRTGSFFFKALGITLLFMAGFPEDLVRKETKYRNLDLLQKYYRSDEDAKGEQLFHPYPPFYPQALVATPTASAKASVTGGKLAVKKPPPPLLSKPSGSQTGAPLYLPPITARPLSATSFPGPTFPPISGIVASHLPNTSVVSSCGNTPTTTTGTPATTTSASLNPTLPPLPLLHPMYNMFPPYTMQRLPAGGYPFMPIWPPVNYFHPGPFPSPLYRHQAFSHATQYGASSPVYYGQPYFAFTSAGARKDSDKKENDLESDSDSDSSSGGSDQSEKENSSDSKEA